MKLIIDIPKANYEKMKIMDEKGAFEYPYFMAIAKGTPLPKEQEPKTIQEKQAESEKYQKAFDDGYANGYSQARFDFEVKTGHWIGADEWYHKCSECGEVSHFRWYEGYIYKWCPMCGAKMEVDE